MCEYHGRRDGSGTVTVSVFLVLEVYIFLKSKKAASSLRKSSWGSMLVEILWKPSPAAFHAKDAGYNLVSFSLLLHATCFLLIKLPAASNTIYLKSGGE